MSRLLIHASHIYKSFGISSLLNDLSLSINHGDCFALIGENGCGKTTLLQILQGNLLPDSGEIRHASNLSIGSLFQEVALDNPHLSVRTFLEEGPLTDLEKRMEACLIKSQLEQWELLHEEYERTGGYRRLPLEKTLQDVHLEPFLDVPINTLSSGQRFRMALIKALLNNPELLLLDEPTNHLDNTMLEWLKKTIRTRDGATVIVSHDRQFLNETCTHLIEIKGGELTSYGGSYDFYLEEKERKLQAQIQAYEAYEEEKKRLKQQIKAAHFSRPKPTSPSDRNIMAYDKHGEGHQKSTQRTLDTLKSRLDELEENPIQHPKPKHVQGLIFFPTSLHSKVVLEFDNVKKSFGEKVLFSEFSKRLSQGDRVLLKGPNGSGKTTLLRCVVGQLEIDSGTIRKGSNVTIAYLDQEIETLPSLETPAAYFEKKFRLSEQDLRKELHKAALGGTNLLHLPFSSLSVGQRKRLMLLSLILERPNILLLDEPTNHLDLLTLEALEKSLLNFNGAIIVVSHDATFQKKIATLEWNLQ